MKEVTLTTDGGCSPNPGPGAWAAILRYGDQCKTISGVAPNTTNNRMEMQAIIEGLRLLREPCRVAIRTDSMYCVYGLRRAGSKKKTKTNVDLHEQLWAEAAKHQIEVVFIKGHAGDTDNELCDAACTRLLPNNQ